MERKLELIANKLIKLFPNTTINIDIQFFYHGAIDQKKRENYKVYIKGYTFKDSRNSFSTSVPTIIELTKLLNREFGKDLGNGDFDNNWSLKH